MTTDSEGNVIGLALGRNGLTDSIPPELGKLLNLEYLKLSRNDLTGPLPPQLGNLRELNVLSLGSNYLSGPVPTELGNLERLEYLHLFDNGFRGPLPHTMIRVPLRRFYWERTNQLSHLPSRRALPFALRRALPACSPAAPGARAASSTARYISTPAIAAVMKAAIEPPIIARRPNRARSCRRRGAIPPIPPIWMAIDEKLAKPDRA